MFVVEFDAKHRACEDGQNPPFDFNVFFHNSNYRATGVIARQRTTVRSGLARRGT
jgi:hypothetical protein